MKILMLKVLYRNQYNNDSFISVVGKIDSQIVACATMHLSKDYACLYNIATLKEFQRRNIASTLISYLINIAKHKGYENVILQASTSGIDLYEKLGFF